MNKQNQMDNKTPIFYGQVEDGKLHLNNQEVFERYLKFLGGLVTVVVKKKRSVRSLSQNGYYWGGVLTTIADELGYDSIEDMHEYFKGKYLTETRYLPNRKTGVLVEVQIPQSTAKLDTVKFGEYVEKIVMWAAGMGIIVLTPEQYYALNP